MTSIGQFFKEKREALGLSLEEMAERTRLQVSYLAALEGDRLDELPGRPYYRLFLRTYAASLGLNFDQIAREFPETEITAEIRLPPAQTVKQRARRAGIAVASVVVFAGILFFFLRYGRFSTTGPGQVEKSATETKSAGPKVAPPPARESTEVALQPPLVLRLEGLEDTGVRVVADRDTLFNGLLKKAEVEQWFAQDSFIITLGKAWAVTAFVNEHKLKRLGRPGEPRYRLVIRADNYERLVDSTALSEPGQE